MFLSASALYKFKCKLIYGLHQQFVVTGSFLITHKLTVCTPTGLNVALSTSCIDCWTVLIKSEHLIPSAKMDLWPCYSVSSCPVQVMTLHSKSYRPRNPHIWLRGLGFLRFNHLTSNNNFTYHIFKLCILRTDFVYPMLRKVLTTDNDYI